MNIHRPTFTALVVLLLLTLLAIPALAQSTASVPAPPAHDPFLTPFIDSQTIVVAHLDVSQIDTTAFDKYITALFDDARTPADAPLRKDIAAAHAIADVFLARFKQLGGRHVYAVVSHPDLWPHQQPLALLVKIEPGGDAKKLRELIISTFGEGHTFGLAAVPPEDLLKGQPATPEEIAADERDPGTLKAVMLRDDVLFIGNYAPLQRLRSIKPEPRPELALSNKAPLEAVASLTADERRALAELLPTFPPELGGGTTEFLARGGLTARLQVTFPPEPSILLAFFQSFIYSGTTTNSAGALPGSTTVSSGGLIRIISPIDSLLLILRDLLLASPDLATALNSPELNPHAPELTAALREILTPNNGILTLDEQHIRLLAPMLVKEMNRAWYAGRRGLSAANLRGIAQAAIVYASDHEDMLPESLEVLVKSKRLTPEQLLNPSDPKHRPYIYRPIIPTNTVDSAVPLVWEQVDDDQTGLNVGFADGHAEWVANRKILDEWIKNAEQQKAQMDARHKAQLDAQKKQP